MKEIRLRSMSAWLLALIGLPMSAFGADSANTVPATPDLGTVAVSVTGGASDESEKRAGEVKNRVIEEIIVTAQKREENIQNVPISIQAFSGDAIAARGIENTAQLGQSVPSLQFSNIGGFPLIYIRGLGTDNFIPSADPSVATYVDGIYTPVGQGGTQSLGNIQRVEVLKGPQGTLFGRNATGGAISVVTKEPGRQFEASGETEYGAFDDRKVRADVSGPITDWLSAGLSAAYQHEDSYYTDTYFAVIPTELRSARLKINIHPSDELSLSLTGSYTREQGKAALVGKNTTPSTLGSLLLMQPEKDDYNSQTDYNGPSGQRQELLYGNLTWKLSAFDIKFLGSIQDDLDGDALDFDGSPEPVAAFSTTQQFIKLQSGELQVISNAETWGADRFKWVTGLYFFHSEAGFNPAYLQAAPQVFTSAFGLAGIPVPQSLQSLLAVLPEDGAKLAFTGILGTKSYSGYAQGTYNFTDWLDLTLGGRLQHEQRYLIKSSTGVVNQSDGSITQIIPFMLGSATADNFSPKAVLSGHLSDNKLIYASYSVGYKSGTFNIVNIYTQPNYIVPEQVTAYELGAKLDLFDGLLRLNGAVFDNEVKNLQSGFISLLSGGAVQFITVPGARTRGVEFDGTLLPLPDLDQGLALTGNAAYVDAKYTDFPSGPGFAQGSGVYSADLDFTGKRIVRTARFSGGFGMVQTIQAPHGPVEIAVDEYFNSGFYYDANNTVKENPYSVLNARISYLHMPWNLRITAFAKNLLDERYHINQLQTDFGINKALAAPREYGIRLNWDF